MAQPSSLPLCHKFTTFGKTTITAIDPELVRRFNIDDSTWAYQYATENGIHIIIKVKNMVDGKQHEANSQDYNE